MSKFTPGPWEVPHFVTATDDGDCKCTSVVEGGYAGGICHIHIDNGMSISEGGNDAPPLEEAKANATLIAAAPDMYEALKKVLGAYMGARDDAMHGDANFDDDSTYQMAVTALKKARGESK